MDNDPVVITSYARTPMGKFLGAFKDMTAPQLGAVAIKSAVERAHLKPTDIQEVIMGCVLPAGLGQAPARQAALYAGLPESTPCTTLNKVCGSGMKAVMFAHDTIVAGSVNIVVAGGMESMTNAPYLLAKGRNGYRLGHAQVFDHMMLDGLEDAYDKGKAMGVFAEATAKEYDLDRKQQDDFATNSFKRAQNAIKNKLFADETVAVAIKNKQGEAIIAEDEHPGSVNPEKIPHLNPAFIKDNGTVTAGNSSAIADGAAALTLMKLSEAKKRSIDPIAKIVGHATIAKKPAQFTTAPIDAIKKLLTELKWKIEDVDLFEINEAFAVVALAAIKELKIPHEKINIHGGAVALGHPIGASGARILVTLLAALKKNNLKRGVAALCIGGGEATAIAVEML